MKRYAIHLCDFRSEPGETECREACWSQGRSCRKCYVDCYRKGWKAWMVAADNKSRVVAKAKADDAKEGTVDNPARGT